MKKYCEPSGFLFKSRTQVYYAGISLTWSLKQKQPYSTRDVVQRVAVKHKYGILFQTINPDKKKELSLLTLSHHKHEHHACTAKSDEKQNVWNCTPTRISSIVIHVLRKKALKKQDNFDTALNRTDFCQSQHIRTAMLINLLNGSPVKVFKPWIVCWWGNVTRKQISPHHTFDVPVAPPFSFYSAFKLV